MNPHVQIDYTNHRGERRLRLVLPITIWFGKSAYHPYASWILTAKCLEKNETRHFFMGNIHEWKPCA
jgi:predicted DNA-binding transcriptional regulator YafY